MHRLDMADLMHIATQAANARDLLRDRRETAFAAAARPSAVNDARERGLQMLADLQRNNAITS